jgi:hypothetical protein
MDSTIVPAAPERLIESRPADIDITRLWRGHVTAADRRGREVTAFVEASSSTAAAKKIAAVIAATEYRKPEDVESRIYNVFNADELIADGGSAYRVLRVFETGWSGRRVVCWVEHPLFLLENAGPLIRHWVLAQLLCRDCQDVHCGRSTGVSAVCTVPSRSSAEAQT